jgi:AcrR family transcriptional regulator
MSEGEMEQRMVNAAVTMLSRTGVTVSLDHLSLEEVIREAGVSRSAVYRRWPYKDLFLGDLVKELAKTTTPTVIEEEVGLVWRVVADRRDWLKTAQQRDSLAAELIRQLALRDFELLLESARFRTYLALQATFASVGDDATREQLGAVLLETEEAHIARVAAAWELLAGLFGFYLHEDADATFETLATLLTAGLRGLVMMALSNPDIAKVRTRLTLLRATEPADWSLPAINAASIAGNLLEPDPSDWDDERIARVCDALDALAPSSL